MVQGEGDSLTGLVEDMERALAVEDRRHCACGYYGKYGDDECDGCPAFDDDDMCEVSVIADVARRLHALRNGLECLDATATCNEVGDHGMKDDEDSLERLLGDMEAVAEGRSCAYFGSQECEGCRVWEDQRPCIECAFDDAARRLRALMPHDAGGRGISPGDTLESSAGARVRVTGVAALPVFDIEGDGDDRVSVAVPYLWHVVESDSWERLEADAAKRVCEYAGAQRSVVDDSRYSCINCPYDEPGPHTDAGCNERMRLDIVRRARALAGTGGGE